MLTSTDLVLHRLEGLLKLVKLCILRVCIGSVGYLLAGLHCLDKLKAGVVGVEGVSKAPYQLQVITAFAKPHQTAVQPGQPCICTHRCICRAIIFNNPGKMFLNQKG